MDALRDAATEVLKEVRASVSSLGSTEEWALTRKAGELDIIAHAAAIGKGLDSDGRSQASKAMSAATSQASRQAAESATKLVATMASRSYPTSVISDLAPASDKQQTVLHQGASPKSAAKPSSVSSGLTGWDVLSKRDALLDDVDEAKPPSERGELVDEESANEDAQKIRLASQEYLKQNPHYAIRPSESVWRRVWKRQPNNETDFDGVILDQFRNHIHCFRAANGQEDVQPHEWQPKLLPDEEWEPPAALSGPVVPGQHSPPNVEFRV